MVKSIVISLVRGSKVRLPLSLYSFILVGFLKLYRPQVNYKIFDYPKEGLVEKARPEEKICKSP